jgi:mRNA interferase YafQ
MKVLKLSGQFKKDLKKYKHKPEQLNVLENILGILQREEPIPPKFKPHLLTGIYSGHMECHVQNDLLLIWLDKTSDTIVLVRFGTHSEIF